MNNAIHITRALIALSLCAFPLSSSAMISRPSITGFVFADNITNKSASKEAPKGQENSAHFRYLRTTFLEEKKSVNKIQYLDSIGVPAAEESVYFEQGKLHKYRFQQNQVDDSGEVEVANGKINFSFTRKGKTIKKTEDFENDVVAPDMIEAHVQANWEAIQKYDTLKVRLLIIERAETVGFKFYKDKDREINGKKVTDIVMQPSNFFISLLVKPARLTFEKDGHHRLLEFQGRLPLRNPANLDQVIDARLVFDESKSLEPATSASYTIH